MRAGRRSGQPGAAGDPAAGATSAPVEGLASALEEVGDRWTLQVVEALLEGPRRFNDIQSGVAGIATNVLAKRLQDLERRGLVVASAYSVRPPRFVYELTQAGLELAGVVGMLARWGARRQGIAGSSGTGPDHLVCGTELEQRWWCPTCDRVVEDDELGPVRIV